MRSLLTEIAPILRMPVAKAHSDWASSLLERAIVVSMNGADADSDKESPVKIPEKRAKKKPIEHRGEAGHNRDGQHKREPLV